MQSPTVRRTLLCTLFLSASCACASLGLGITLGGDGYRDDVLVPLVFSGPSAGLVTTSEFHTFGLDWQPHAELRLDYATNRFGHESLLLFYQARMLAWKSIEWNATMPLQWGTGLDLQARDAYLFSWDDSHLYWLSSIGLPFALRCRTKWHNGWTGQGTIASNALAYVAHRADFPENKVDPLKTASFYLSTPWNKGAWLLPWQYPSGFIALELATPSQRIHYTMTGEFAVLRNQAFSLGARAGLLYHWGTP